MIHRLCVLLALPAFLIGCEIEGTPGGERPDFVDDSEPVEEYTPPPPTPVARSFTILHTNDEHSHLLGFGPNSDYPFAPVPGDVDGSLTIGNAAVKIAAATPTRGGFARRDYLLNKLRTEATDPVITVSAGDSTMGTLFALAGSGGAPDFVAMALAGYDYMTLGNHEFDFGPDILGLTIQAGANTTFGGLPKIIASNVHFDDVELDGSGVLLMSQYGEGGSGALIQPWDVKVLANGLKVGVLGALGYAAALVAPAKSPISFSVPKTGDTCTASCATPGESCVQGYCVNPLDASGHVAAAAAELQAYVDVLRNDKGVDVVVLISHMGTTEDANIASLTTGIDVIIGGHTHDMPPATVIGSTIVAPAGAYGALLGELTVTVDPDGSVGIDDDRTELHAVDWTLDAGIFGESSLPEVVSPTLERAVGFTLAVVTPTAEALNAAFVPSINMMLSPAGKAIDDLWSSSLSVPSGDAVLTSDHDITKAGSRQDSHLSHLVTDAVFGAAQNSGCFFNDDTPFPMTTAKFMVALQANGVLRDDLEFGTDARASFADVFRVLPNGASPYQPTVPGFPLVAFQLPLIELVAGIDVGITRGLIDDEFFLSYSGISIEYDPEGPAFNAATFDAMSTEPQSRLTKLTVPSLGVVFEYDSADTTTPWIQRWSFVNPAEDSALVVTNLYIAGFMQAFGFTPLDPYSGDPIDPSLTEGVSPALALLSKTILCNVAPAANCGSMMQSIAPCVAATAGDVPPDLLWPEPLIEVKEWAVLFGYIQALGGAIPDCAYEDDETSCGPFPSRVVATSM